MRDRERQAGTNLKRVAPQAGISWLQLPGLSKKALLTSRMLIHLVGPY
jgi:hypothetical protein